MRLASFHGVSLVNGQPPRSAVCLSYSVSLSQMRLTRYGVEVMDQEDRTRPMVSHVVRFNVNVMTRQNDYSSTLLFPNMSSVVQMVW